MSKTDCYAFIVPFNLHGAGELEEVLNAIKLAVKGVVSNVSEVYISSLGESRFQMFVRLDGRYGFPKRYTALVAAASEAAGDHGSVFNPAAAKECIYERSREWVDTALANFLPGVASARAEASATAMIAAAQSAAAPPLLAKAEWQGYQFCAVQNTREELSGKGLPGRVHPVFPPNLENFSEQLQVKVASWGGVRDVAVVPVYTFRPAVNFYFFVESTGRPTSGGLTELTDFVTDQLYKDDYWAGFVCKPFKSSSPYDQPGVMDAKCVFIGSGIQISWPPVSCVDMTHGDRDMDSLVRHIAAARPNSKHRLREAFERAAATNRWKRLTAGAADNAIVIYGNRDDEMMTLYIRSLEARIKELEQVIEGLKMENLAFQFADQYRV